MEKKMTLLDRIWQKLRCSVDMHAWKTKTDDCDSRRCVHCLASQVYASELRRWIDRRTKEECGKIYDHSFGDSEDRDSATDYTYVCKKCGHLEKAPINRPPNLRT